jgi:hypothetical protein
LRRPGKGEKRHRLTRTKSSLLLAQRGPATVVMEACGSAHFQAREVQARGHEVRLLPPRDVHRYLKGNKTDRSDTRAILEANRNEDIRPVPIKSVEHTRSPPCIGCGRRGSGHELGASTHFAACCESWGGRFPSLHGCSFHRFSARRLGRNTKRGDASDRFSVMGDRARTCPRAQRGSCGAPSKLARIVWAVLVSEEDYRASSSLGAAASLHP